MRKSFLIAAPLAAALGLAMLGSANAQECYDPASKDTAECKPLTRAEVRAEAEKAGAKIVDAGECPNFPAAKGPGGKVRTRAAVRAEAAEAARTGTPIDMGECPK